MKIKDDKNINNSEVNGKLAELTNEELAQVSGGDVTSANIVGAAVYLKRPGGVLPGTRPVNGLADAAPTAPDIISELKS